MPLKSFAMAHVLFVLAAPAWAQVTVDAPDIGEIYQTNTATADIAIANTGSKPVRILGIAPRNATDVVGPVPPQVAPKSTVQVSVRIPIGMQAGKQQHVFIVKTSLAGKQSETQVRVRAFGLSVLDEVKPAVDLGAVEFNAPPKTHTLTLSSREVADFRITKILDLPDFVTARIQADGRSIAIAGNPAASWGRHEGYVKVALNSNVQSQAWIEVKADVHGAVFPLHNPLELGVVRNPRVPSIVQLRSRDGKAVVLGKIATKGFEAQTDKQACVGESDGCAQIAVRLTARQTPGQVRGILLVDLPDFGRKVSISVNGLFAPESGRSMAEGDEGGGTPIKPNVESPASAIGLALNRNSHDVPAQPAVDPPGKGPLLKWQTSNEAVVYGYLIYRSDSESGPFMRVNREIVPSRSQRGVNEGSSHAWRDTTALPGKTYWYYIGLINTDGSKQQLSGPQKVVAK